MKYIVSPYLKNSNKVQYNELMQKPFYINNLFIIDEQKDLLLFEGWNGIEMGGSWYKVHNNEEKIEMEFYDTYYHIIPPKKNQLLKLKFVFPFPINLNDFISDCNRCYVNLYWTKEALKKYSPMVLLNQEELKTYYDKILEKIGKL